MLSKPQGGVCGDCLLSMDSRLRGNDGWALNSRIIQPQLRWPGHLRRGARIVRWMGQESRHKRDEYPDDNIAQRGRAAAHDVVAGNKPLEVSGQNLHDDF